MAVLKDCPTLRYYTYTDAQKILTGLMSQIKDRNSAEYKKLFDELMAVHDQKMKYIPEFASKMKGVPSVASALGTKAVDYLQYAPAPDLNQAYAWLKESAETAKGESDGAVLHYFVDVSMQKVKADTNHTDQFFQDYINASQYADDAIAAEDNAKKKAVLQTIKDNLVAMFVNSGVADCESLQNIYGPKVEENKADSAFLKKTITILKMMKCNECEAYFKASDYLYRVNPTADAAVGVAYMYYKKGDYDTAVKYFDEALGMETDNAKKSEMAYATAAALWQAKKLSQARTYAQKAISFNENYGEPYILLAQMYGSNPNWSDEPALGAYLYGLDRSVAERSVREVAHPGVVGDDVHSHARERLEVDTAAGEGAFRLGYRNAYRAWWQGILKQCALEHVNGDFAVEDILRHFEAHAELRIALLAHGGAEAAMV